MNPSAGRPRNNSRDQEPSNLEELITQIDLAAEGSQRVSVGAIVERVGLRSFGVLLLFPGLITLAPLIGDIPGVPTVMGLFVLLVAGQLLIRRRHFWLPQWLLRRSMDQGRLCKALGWMRPAARFVDRLLRPRLAMLVSESGTHAAALVCMTIALMMPAMEFVPFSANGAGAALTAFGLSLTTRDGLLALIAYAFTALTLGAVLYFLI